VKRWNPDAIDSAELAAIPAQILVNPTLTISQTIFTNSKLQADMETIHTMHREWKMECSLDIVISGCIEIGAI